MWIGSTFCSIVDGDDFRIKHPIVRGAQQFDTVRILGIESPEIGLWGRLFGENHLHHGDRAKEALQKFLKDKEILISFYIPCYRRSRTYISGCESVVSSREKDGGCSLTYVASGVCDLFPIVCPSKSPERFEELRRAMSDAKQDGRGIWAQVDPPWRPTYQFKLMPQGEGWPHPHLLCYKTGEYGCFLQLRKRIPRKNWVLFPDAGSRQNSAYWYCWKACRPWRK